MGLKSLGKQSFPFLLACFIPDALLRCSSEKQKQKCLVLLLVDGIKSLAFKKNIVKKTIFLNAFGNPFDQSSNKLILQLSP
jgi:hypothetical protein